MSETKHTREIAVPVPSPDRRPRLLRVRGDDEGPKEVSLGVLAPVEDGKAIPPGADLVRLKPCDGHFRVETIYDGSSGLRRGGGWKSLSVSRKKFEDNWDKIFGKKEPVPVVN